MNKIKPVEQQRWNESNVDTLFYAGAQNYINSQLNFSPGMTAQRFHFNIVQQPINMITGYQRQHRKTGTFQATENSDSRTTDQYTKLIINVSQEQQMYETFSRSCELAAIAGKNLIQPYLDFSSDDPLQGELKLKVWEYNSFLIDPWYRNSDLSDCRYIWCQEYIDKDEAIERFPKKKDQIKTMTGSRTSQTNFYFLPESYSADNRNMLIMSYIWYRGRKKRKRLYSPKLEQFFDFAGGDAQLAMINSAMDFDVVNVDMPCWYLCAVLNDKLMFHGSNPLYEGSRAPMVSLDWNYSPEINQWNLRNRSLVRVMRDAQFLYNWKVITNHDIAASTINSGYKRKVGAVANEDNLKQTGQGRDILINPGYELTDVEKIIPSAVPESDLALANLMGELIFKTAGIDMENWSAQQDKQASTLTVAMKQAANLLVFQKYFDQWDVSLKLLEELKLEICLSNWNPAKIERVIGEEPTPFFYSRIFAKYKTVVEEGLLTPTQRNLQAQAMLDINQAYGREVFPPSFVIKDMNLQGRDEMLAFLQQQEEQTSQMQQQQQMLEQAVVESQLRELESKIINNIAHAKERVGRADSNIGLLEERLSEISKNQSLSVKDKMEAMHKLLEAAQIYGKFQTAIALNSVQELDRYEEMRENYEREEAKVNSTANEFMRQVMGG